ncbi:MAG: hypothetical protein Q8O41_09610, partial [Candidatus Methanoperedens sp.]|nr:hypothetical protein [Candidatus Methanoperedens sp.]
GGKEYSDVDLLNQSFRMNYSKNDNIPTANCGGGETIQSSSVNITAFTPLQTTTSILAGKIINDTSANPNRTQSLFNVTQHYFNIMAPDIAFDLCGPSSDPVDYGASTMLIDYTTTSALTCLHITDNWADVGIS